VVHPGIVLVGVHRNQAGDRREHCLYRDAFEIGEDVVVSLASSNPAVAVPATCSRVPQGSGTAVFSAAAQSAPSGIVVSATFKGVSKSQSPAVSATTP